MRVSSKNQVSGKFCRTAMAGLGLEPLSTGIGIRDLSKQNSKI